MRVQYQGRALDARTKLMLEEANRILKFPLTLTQGSYSNSVGASAGTHNGGGAMDVSSRGLGMEQKLAIVHALRTVGFAAWLRPPIAGLWTEHIHAVAVGCPDLAPAAKRQVEELRDGGDGLKGGAPDPHRNMHLPVVSWEQYLESKKPKPPAPAKPKAQKGSDVHKNGSRLLKKGDKGTDVAFVQRFIDSRLVEDGDFGPVTEAAVKKYQDMRGLPQTGQVGEATWSAILGKKVDL